MVIDLSIGSVNYVNEVHMPGDPKECREHAQRCLALAAETNDLRLKESLTDLAKRWASIAADLEATRALLAEAGLLSSEKSPSRKPKRR